ncbi:hypothetical protein BDR07DRAFT_1430005 [Suillus spraguei]|nr:hypothetical protein BDR07DRAFT_1430005 [Suillus spraguei]
MAWCMDPIDAKGERLTTRAGEPTLEQIWKGRFQWLVSRKRNLDVRPKLCRRVCNNSPNAAHPGKD